MLSIFDADDGKLSPAEHQRREKLAVDMLLEHVGIAPIRGSALIDVNYTSASPDWSLKIANAWTQQFIASSIDRRFASTADARTFLEARLGTLRAKLENSERELVNYAQQKGIVALAQSKSPDGRTEVGRTLVSNDLEALNDALSKAIADRLAAESQRSGSSAGASSEALNNVAIGQLRQRRAEVAAEYARLMTQFEPGYPQAKALAEQVKALDASIE